VDTRKSDRKGKSRRYCSPSSSSSSTSSSPSQATTDIDDNRVGRKAGSSWLAVLECPDDRFAGVLDYWSYRLRNRHSTYGASQARKMGRKAKNMKVFFGGTPILTGRNLPRKVCGSESSSRPAMTSTCPRGRVCTEFPSSSRATLRRGSLGTYRDRISRALRGRLGPSPRRSIGCCRPTRSRTLWGWRWTSLAGRRPRTTRGWTASRYAYGASPIFATTSTPRGRWNCAALRPTKIPTDGCLRVKLGATNLPAIVDLLEVSGRKGRHGVG